MTLRFNFPVLTMTLGLVAALVLMIPMADLSARGTYLTPFQSTYPNSLTDDNVINGTGKSCQLCHQYSSGGGSWNGYGWDLRMRLNLGDTIAQAIVNVEANNSDADPGEFQNYNPAATGEIDSNTQPGWTDGPNNTIYLKNGTTNSNQLPPVGILGSLDPGASVEPDIKANGQDGPLNLTTSDNVTLTIHLDPGALDGDPADWWLYAVKDASNTWWAQYRPGLKPKWTKSTTPIRFAGATLRTVNSYTVLGPRTLPLGDYVFGFAVDDNKDGNYDGTFLDTVDVSVN